MQKTYPSMRNFYCREKGEFVLEEDKEQGSYRWAAVEQRRVGAGCVNPDTIAVDLIREIGPHGSGYLTADHTLQWLRSDEYLIPRIAVRGPRATWEAAGAPDSYALARQQVAAFRSVPGAPLDGQRTKALHEFVSRFQM